MRSRLGIEVIAGTFGLVGQGGQNWRASEIRGGVDVKNVGADLEIVVDTAKNADYR